NIINNKNTDLTKQDLVDYINNHGNQFAFTIDDINGSALLTDGCAIAVNIGRQTVAETSCHLTILKLKYDSTNGLVCSNMQYTLNLSDTSDYYWAILRDTIEAL
ncbi:MAG: hypothetical protein II238_02795, partial [Alphaproteobacteria bacterium]|nr:hypothetical protein [Alphaproteobacteria bacterium]